MTFRRAHEVISLRWDAHPRGRRLIATLPDGLGEITGPPLSGPFNPKVVERHFLDRCATYLCGAVQSSGVIEVDGRLYLPAGL